MMIPIDEIRSVVLWSFVALFLAATLFWTYEVLVLARGTRRGASSYGPDDPRFVYGLDDVQVRILTIGDEPVVQATVDALPDEIAERYVIAERPMYVEGATVLVVPEEFTCEATRKGRALEWARRNVPCEREFVLYLDEDTVVTPFAGLPDADVVQFSERPIRTGSFWAHVADVYRLGFQFEQRAFRRLSVPLYAWGGGLAVRAELEERIGWDRRTLIEDSAFIWTAATTEAASFALVDARFRNQSPPTIGALFGQRRRWIAGSREENVALPIDYWLLYGIRNFSWGFSPLLVPVAAVSYVYPGAVVFQPLFAALSTALVAYVFLWGALGHRYYRSTAGMAVAVVVLAPVAMLIHSAGALVGLFAPPRDFEVTAKVDPRTLDDGAAERVLEGASGVPGEDEAASVKTF